MKKKVLIVFGTRPEAIEVNAVKLVGTNKTNIIREVRKLLLEKDIYNSVSAKHNPYDDGLATDRK